MERFKWDFNLGSSGFMKKYWFFRIVSVFLSIQLVSGAGYVEQYLNSPEICPPVSSGTFSHLLKSKIRLANFPNNSMIVKLSRWQERNTLSAHLNFRCTFEVTAPRGYGVMVTVRSLHLRRYMGRSSRACRDYLRFRQEGSKVSTDVCGEVESSDKSEFPEGLWGPRFYYDPKAGMDVSILTDDSFVNDAQKPLSIELIFTAYHHCTASDLATNEARPCSPTSQDSCIDSNLFCDGYVNCGLDAFGLDEEQCEEKTTSISRTMSVFIFAVTAVGTLVVAAVCILIICCCCRSCRTKSTAASTAATTQESSHGGPGLNLPRSTSPTAPVVSDITEMPIWRANTPTAPKAEVENDDLPPSYKDLFPVQDSVVIMR